MSLPQTPKRGGGSPRPNHFTYVQIAKGERLFGYLAGPVMWFDIHQSDLGSKPCLEIMTGGELVCPRCASPKLPVTKGALPFYHAQDFKPLMVWVDEGDRDRIDKLEVFKKLQIGREKRKGAPLWVEYALNQEPPFSSTLPERQKPADLTRSLLRMWALPELTNWYLVTQGESDNVVSQVEVVRVVKKGTNAQAVENQEQAGSEKEARVRRNRLFIEHARHEIGNGHHKPPNTE